MLAIRVSQCRSICQLLSVMIKGIKLGLFPKKKRKKKKKALNWVKKLNECGAVWCSWALIWAYWRPFLSLGADLFEHLCAPICNAKKNSIHYPKHEVK